MNATRLREKAFIAFWAPLRQSSKQPWTRSFSILRAAPRASQSNICPACLPRPTLSPRVPRASTRQWPTRSRFNSTKASPDPTPHLGSPEPAPSLSQRLRKLTREYGWSALGIYLSLSALDFPFCFLAVRSLGTDRIGRWEHELIEAFWKVVRIPFPNLGKKTNEAEPGIASEEGTTVREGAAGWGVEQAEADNSGSNASIWTQLALAYAIHKSFIFIRVPLTAAVTPRVVKTLRGWGWDIGKRKPKPKSS